MLWPLGINVLSLFGNFMYSKMCSHSLIHLIIVAVKVFCHCGIVSVFDVKNVTLESISNSVFSLTYKFDVAPSAFQTIYKVIALAGAIS